MVKESFSSHHRVISQLNQNLNRLYCQGHQGQGYQSVQQPEKKMLFY